MLLSPITCCAAIYSINLISKCFNAVCHDMPHWSLSRRSAEGRLTANHTIRCNQLEIKSKKWFCGPTLFHLFKRKISPWFGADHLWSILCVILFFGKQDAMIVSYFVNSCQQMQNEISNPSVIIRTKINTTKINMNNPLHIYRNAL